MDWLQLTILTVVVIATFVLGFIFGEWLRTLAPSIMEALNAAWDAFASWASQFGRGTAISIPTEGPQTAVIDVSGPPLRPGLEEYCADPFNARTETCGGPGYGV